MGERFSLVRVQSNTGDIGTNQNGRAYSGTRYGEPRPATKKKEKSAMITRLSISERAEIMRECRDKVSELHEEIWELLTEKLAPYDSRNDKAFCSAEDSRNGTLPYDDKDTPLITRVFKALDKAYEELDARCGELDAEEGARYEAYEMFYAWELGLCPYAMREHRRKKTPHVWHSLHWKEIAEFLSGAEMSREDTERAVSEYLKDKETDGDKVIAVTRESARVKEIA